MKKRHRILRRSEAIREAVSETRLHSSNLICPLFIIEGENQIEGIDGLPDYYRRSLDNALVEIEELRAIGVNTFLLFAKCRNELKTPSASEALNDNGLMQRSIRSIKDKYPEVTLMSDVALDPYSSDGHDGIVDNGKILNDLSVEVLTQMALSHASCGVDFVAPSDMMDGRVRAMRLALEDEGFHETGIMSYSAKYCSALYGPFRAALDSAPGFGDKKTYQMNPANRLEALKEVEADIEEGADIVMVKPALSYLDIISDVKRISKVPVSAYHVSGEYAMIKYAAKYAGMIESDLIWEHTIAIKRAGADLIATYFAKELARKIYG
jgi:porphobilinogen synthase